MGIAEIARQLDRTLSASSRRTLNFLLDEPQETAKLTATQVAAKLGVHETTVIRLAKQLGYPGYRQVREDLAKHDLASLSSADRVRSRSDSDYTLAALIDNETAALKRLARLVPQTDIDTLAQCVLDARRTYLFGPPYAQAVLSVMERRLRRFGVDVVSLPLSGRLIAEHLTMLQPDDLVISFVFRMPGPKVDRITGYAHSIGAQVAVIADEDGLAYKQRPDQIIVAPRGPNTNQRSLIVPFIISYALQFALHHLAGDETERALLLLDDIARVVGDDEPSHGA